MISKKQYNLLSENENYQKRWNRFEIKMRRRYQLIDNLIDRELADESPKHWLDMYDYASEIVRRVSNEVMYAENGVYSDGDDEFELETWVDKYIKDNWGQTIFDYYIKRK
jgi:hypothetical protein